MVCPRPPLMTQVQHFVPQIKKRQRWDVQMMWTYELDLWPWRSWRLWLMRVIVLHLCTEAGHNNRSCVLVCVVVLLLSGAHPVVKLLFCVWVRLLPAPVFILRLCLGLGLEHHRLQEHVWKYMGSLWCYEAIVNNINVKNCSLYTS